MKHKIAGIIVFLQLLLILFSWVAASVAPTLQVKSLLSGEGIRWFFGNFADNLSNRLLVWLLLCTIAYGAYVNSGLGRALTALLHKKPLAYGQRHALIWVLILLVIMALLIVLLAFVPHAVLLGVSGGLFPSAFSAAIVPMAAFIITVLSFTYGMVGGTYASLDKAFDGLYAGIIMFAPLFLIYVLAAQLFYSVSFVFF